jgi:PX domain
MMESSVIVDIDSESRLMFATNSSGVVLISHFGTIGFSAEEFQYYQCLFKLTDTESIGKLRMGSTPLSSILRRSNLRDDVMEKLLFLSITSISDSSGHDKEYGCSISLSDSDEVNYAQDEHEYVGLTEMSNGHKTEGGNASCGAADSSQFLSLHQWLLLCKLILQLQLNPWAAPDGSLLEVICSLYEFDNQHSIKTDGFTQPPSPLRLDDTPDGRGIVIEDKLNQGNRLSYVEKAASSNGHSEGGYTRNRKWKVPAYGCFANFRLGVAVTTQDMITAARVAGWEVCSEGFQKPYTKFSVSVSTISCSSESKNKNAATGGDGDEDGDANTATTLSGNKTGGMGHLNGVIIPGMQEALPSNTSPSVVEPMPVYAPLVPVTTSVSVVSAPASVATELPALANAGLEIAVTISPAPVVGKKNKKGAKKKTIAASVAVAVAAASGVSSSVGGTVLDSALCAADSSLSSHADPRVLGSVAPSSSSSSASPSPVPPRAESGDVSSSTSSSTSPFYEKAEGNHNDIFTKPFQHSCKDEEHQYSSSSSTDCSHHVDRDNCINAGCERATDKDKDKEKGRRKETTASDIVYEGDVLGQFESQRRYSDFEALVSVLQRLYRGVILPPLPPKTWLTQLQQQTQSAQLFAVQRMAELQLFLSALLAHPLMRHSFEIAMFLRASKAGLNSFRLTFPLFSFDSNGAIIATCKNKNLAKSSTGYLSGELNLLYICDT